MKKIKRCYCPDVPEGTIHKLAVVLVKSRKTIVVKKKGLDEHLSLGGKHEGDETSTQGLQREAMEELQIRISNPTFLGRYQDITTDLGAPIILDAYLAETKDQPIPDQEIESFLWVDRYFKDRGIKLASIIEYGIIPELIKRDLI